MDGKDDAEKSKAAAAKLLPLLEKAAASWPEILSFGLPRKRAGMVFGRRMGICYRLRGLDHVYASGEDVNLLVLDTDGLLDTAAIIESHSRPRWPVCRGGQRT